MPATTFCHHVIVVLLWRTEEKVLGTDASSIIALVAYISICRGKAKCDGIEYSVNVKGGSSYFGGAITLRVDVSLPLKALTKLRYNQSSPGATKETPK